MGAALNAGRQRGWAVYTPGRKGPTMAEAQSSECESRKEAVLPDCHRGLFFNHQTRGETRP